MYLLYMCSYIHMQPFAYAKWNILRLPKRVTVATLLNHSKVKNLRLTVHAKDDSV